MASCPCLRSRRLLQAKLFFYDATKLESDAENRCRYDRSRRNHSSLLLRRLESDAERCCGRNRCHSGGFLLRIMPPSWHPVPACVRDGCCRRNHSSLTLRRLESDAERCCGRDRCRSGGFVLRIMPPSWHPVPACVRDGCCRRNHSSLPLRKLESDA